MNLVRAELIVNDQVRPKWYFVRKLVFDYTIALLDFLFSSRSSEKMNKTTVEVWK